MLFFRVAILNPSEKKRLAPRLGSGGKVDSTQIAISVLHRSRASSVSQPVVDSARATAQAVVMLLDGMSGSPKMLREDTLQWSTPSLVWQVPGQTDAEVPSDDISALLSRFYDVGSFQGNHTAHGLQLVEAEIPANNFLRAQGYTEGYRFGSRRQRGCPTCGR